MGAVKRDRLELEGSIVQSCKGIFTVKVGENHIINCTLSGKIKQNSVRILVGDIVIVEVSEYDTDKGRIIFRKK